MASGGSGTNTIQLLLILDDVSHQAYLQMSGPSDAWFSWGFGSSTMSGTYALVSTGASVSERKLGNHNAGTQLANSITVLSNSFNGSQRFISLSRPLSTPSSAYYSFNVAQSSLSLIWAIGSSPVFAYEGINNHGAISATNAAVPDAELAAPVFSSGRVTLSLTNLLVTVTNYLETSTDLGSSSNTWTEAKSLFSPSPCGTFLLSYVTNVTFQATNGAFFFRVRR